MILRRSYVIFLLLFGLYSQALAQHKEAFVISDNDAYLLSRHDGYYTNGLLLGISSPGKRDSSSLVSFGIRQDLFTPGERDFLDISFYFHFNIRWELFLQFRIIAYTLQLFIRYVLPPLNYMPMFMGA